MSSFNCGKCSSSIVDTEYGSLTGCTHYKHDCRCNEKIIECCILCAARAEIKAGASIEKVINIYQLDRLAPMKVGEGL